MYQKKVDFMIMDLNYGCGPCCNYVKTFILQQRVMLTTILFTKLLLQTEIQNHILDRN